MRVLLRRLRGVLGIASIWGIAWFLTAMAFGETVHLTGSGGDFQLSERVFQASIFAVFGSITGVGFSVFIAASFRRRQLEDLRAGQFAIGGGVIGVFFGALVELWLVGWRVEMFGYATGMVFPLAFFGTMGCITAVGSFKIAQRSLPASNTDLLK